MTPEQFDVVVIAAALGLFALGFRMIAGDF